MKSPRSSFLANMLFFLYLLCCSLIFEALVPLYLLGFFLLKQGRLDDAMRIHNRLYGYMIVKASYPLVRVRRTGSQHIKGNTPCVVVINHRSFADIFLCSMIPILNMTVFVRSWPFRLFVFGWYMRLARYMDIETAAMHEITEYVDELSSRGVSMLMFPEGHRSRDGKLQRFHSGAFHIAADHDLPVIPVCITGTENLTSLHKRLIRPTKVLVEILPPVYPETFPEHRRALKMRRAVEKMYREHLDE